MRKMGNTIYEINRRYWRKLSKNKIVSAIGPGEVKNLYKPLFTSKKGDNGRLLIIAGSKRYHGAPLLALTIASKIVDLVFFSSVPENNELAKKMKAGLREFIIVPRGEVEKNIPRCDAVLLGPGMGESKKTRKLVNQLLKKYPDKKFILDADALKMVDKKMLGRNCLLTPHAGEFQAVFKMKATQKNAQEAAKKYKCVILLKGPVDAVCNSNGQCKFDYASHPGLTKGGTGDVLAGLIAALACKNDLFLAARAGVFLLGLTGERLSKEVSYYYNPSDLILEIPKTIKWCNNF
jgi:NAD(P)H-hydrate epimerase